MQSQSRESLHSLQPLGCLLNLLELTARIRILSARPSWYEIADRLKPPSFSLCVRHFGRKAPSIQHKFSLLYFSSSSHISFYWRVLCLPIAYGYQSSFVCLHRIYLHASDIAT